MTITAQSIIKEVQVLLQDVDGIRWPATELVDHLNDGQREMAVLRPDMFSVLAPMVLVAGATQALPAACLTFMGMPRNTLGLPITRVDRAMLDAVMPGWAYTTAKSVLRHYMYDERLPKQVLVYPPAKAGTSVDIEYATLPTGTPAASGATWNTVTGNIDCDDTCKNPLIHWCLFRAWAKDAEFGGNATLSAAHYQLFKAGLGSDAATAAAVTPK